MFLGYEKRNESRFDFKKKKKRAEGLEEKEMEEDELPSGSVLGFFLLFAFGSSVSLVAFHLRRYKFFYFSSSSSSSSSSSYFCKISS